MKNVQHNPILIATTVLSMTSGLSSVLASSTIIVMIFKSSKKLNDPYRRLIFGISFFDLIQSLSHALVIFRSNPGGNHLSWFAIGNKTSCHLLGFLYFAGHNGSLFYNVSLNIFYVCLVKYNVRKNVYSSRIEPFLHGLPISWSIISSSILLSTNHLNPSMVNKKCYISPHPSNCLDNPNVECIHGTQAYTYRILFHLGPIFLALFGILFSLGVLWWTVTKLERQMNRYRMSNDLSRIRRTSTSTFQRSSNILIPDGSAPIEIDQNNAVRRLSRLRSYYGNTNTDNNTGETCLARRRHAFRCRRGKGFFIQALFYTLAFLLSHTFSVVFSSLKITGSEPRLPLLVLARLFNPLQGIFNILVYTRPHVAKERLRDPSLTWWGAFKKVVKSGGDDDNERTNRLRRGFSTTRPSPCLRS